MSPAPLVPITPGWPHPVIEVATHPTGHTIADFLGPVEFVIATPDGNRHRLTGFGYHDSTGVHFYEGAGNQHHQVARIWRIDPAPYGGFAACYQAAT